ncbi:MAG: helix-turn-helix domain-containing protein [Nostoc sp.]|uniref:helix-turn-helix domain-containing protein n=1 Tax=Nostoc sp. TaxID=1180 RepID=UPI002FF654F3
MNNFASFTLGQISTPVNILKEFLEIFNRRHKCKAAILSWLDGKHFYGQEWVRTTNENLGETLGYCRETISKHLRELVTDKLIDELPAQYFPKDTANIYRLNPNWLPPIEFEKSEWAELSKVLGFWKYPDILSKALFFEEATLQDELTLHYRHGDADAKQTTLGEAAPTRRCEKIDIDRPKNEPINANNPPTLETNLNFFKNNNTDVAEKKEAMEEPEPDWESIVAATNTWEQNQISHFVEKSEQVDSSDEIDPHDDSSSALEIKAVSNLISLPTKNEIRETCTELKRLRINPDPCLGVIKKYWGNVAGAIVRVKEAIQEGWCDNPTGLFINSCQSGAKAKNAVTSDIKTWFDWAYKQGIVRGMEGGQWAFLPDGSRLLLLEMMRRYPMEGT